MQKWSCRGGEAGTELRTKTEFVVVRGSGHVVIRRPWWLRFQLMAEEENRDRERGEKEEQGFRMLRTS
ncbi:unnamed protein product [Brassica napus]|uniref:(rape) hypothetical protein n=1 Tax=Brassica napus TaxID=3708 RepID=A0A816XG45_BRANA|nr:unnamed protein product [Brassica napus]